jgi:hypothetical protein
VRERVKPRHGAPESCSMFQRSILDTDQETVFTHVWGGGGGGVGWWGVGGIVRLVRELLVIRTQVEIVNRKKKVYKHRRECRRTNSKGEGGMNVSLRF